MLNVLIMFYSSEMGTFAYPSPFQVALQSQEGRNIAATAFCAERNLSLRVRGPSVTYDDQLWAVFCFSDYRCASFFREEFKGKWIHSHLWRDRQRDTASMIS
ncbi:hypothetical protein [Tardiphaga robiniae]|uniref:hypothetical protein n=1 Tax=Tardiphaga robiniae TaxID=943830 RepID=UPI0015866865|nr:hypothetical protein [Tardiphaga robiniae]